MNPLLDPITWFGLLTPPALLVLAQAAMGSSDASSVFTPLLQLGAVGAVLAWFALVDTPAKAKAAKEATDSWRDQLEKERAHSIAQRESFERALEKLAEALGKNAEGQVALAKSLEDLKDEIRDEHRRAA